MLGARVSRVASDGDRAEVHYALVGGADVADVADVAARGGADRPPLLRPDALVEFDIPTQPSIFVGRDVRSIVLQARRRRRARFSRALRRSVWDVVLDSRLHGGHAQPV